MSAPRLTDRAAVLTPAMEIAGRDTAAPDFYAALDCDFGGFEGHALISEHRFDGDWGMWERHPKGDEFIYLLAGAATFVCLDTEGNAVETRLDTPGQYLVVPKGVWHTARTDTETRALFVTPGAGTEHTEDPS